MAKELPYFQFEPAEYLTKDISFCPLCLQGLFINVCAYYWQRQGSLTRTQFLRRLNYPKEFDQLVAEGVVDLIEDDISIKFLDLQYAKATDKSKTNSINGSKGGRPKKKNLIKTEIKAKENPIESETRSESKGIREDKIREDKIREDVRFDFSKSLIAQGADKYLVKDWMKVRRLKKAANTETAFNLFINEVALSDKPINTILTTCIENSWKGYKASWEGQELNQQKKTAGYDSGY